MRKVTLPKNLELAGELFLEGQEIEVEDSVYEYLMTSFMIERRTMVEEAKRHQAELEVIVARAKGNKSK